MRTILAGLTLALATTPAAAENWYYLGDGDSGIVYADAHSVRTVGEATHINVLMGLPDGVDGGETWFIISKHQVRCSRNEMRATEIESYYEDHSYRSSEAISEDWVAIEPNSFAESMKQFACDGVRGDTVDDPFLDADDFFLWDY